MKVGDMDINYILANYAFVLPVGKSTPDEFVEEIKRVFDCTEPHNQSVIQYINSLKGVFFCSRLSGTVTYIQHGKNVSIL